MWQGCGATSYCRNSSLLLESIMVTSPQKPQQLLTRFEFENLKVAEHHFIAEASSRSMKGPMTAAEALKGKQS